MKKGLIGMKKQLRRIASAFLGAIFMLSAAACSGSQSQSQGGDSGYNDVTITIGSYYARTTSQGQALEAIKTYVEERSEGAVKVDVFHESSIGNEAELANAQQDGSVDLAFTASTGVGLFVPALNIFELFFAYEDRDQQMEVYDAVRDKLDAAFEEKGYKLLGFYREGPRDFVSTMPITSLDDIADVKYRTPATQLYANSINALGANAISLPLGDVYTSLQTGVVVGQEGPLELVVSNKFYEQCKYITETEHVYTPLWITYSLQKWDQLNEQTQQLIQEAVESSMTFQQQLWDEKAVADKEYLLEQGVRFVELEDREKWVEAVAEYNRAFAEENGELGVAIYEAIQALKG